MGPIQAISLGGVRVDNPERQTMSLKQNPLPPIRRRVPYQQSSWITDLSVHEATLATGPNTNNERKGEPAHQ